MPRKPKTPAKSIVLVKNTVSMPPPAKTTPKAPAKTAKAAPVKAAKGRKEDLGKLASIQKASKPKPKAAVKKAPAKKVAKAAAPKAESEDKRSVGRPSKYKPEYCQQLINYFDLSKAAYKEVTLPAGEGRERVEILPEVFPTFEEFAADIGVCYDTLRAWATDKNENGSLVNPEFSEAYSRARTRQTAILFKGGMAGAFDGRFAGLAAKNLAGWSDKVEQAVDVAVLDRVSLEDRFVSKMRAAHERQAKLMQERGILTGD